METAHLFEKAEKTVALLKEKGLSVATAESCTGGMVSAFITSVSGVSEVFELGITSYSCRIKNEVLGVDGKVLDTLGAISEETAEQMAENVRLMAGSHIGVSVTGVAGPQSSEGHPVGYIFIAISGENGTKARLLNLKPEDRNEIRKETVAEVYNLIDEYVTKGINDESTKV